MTSGNAYFRVSETTDASSYAQGVYDEKTHLVKFRNCCWFTNLDHAQRHVSIPLDLGFTYYGHEDMYPRYDNYDAISVDKIAAIPCDYDGPMGVPITFLDKYCPEQFEIIGISGELAEPVMIDGKKKSGRFYVNGKRLFDRIVIKKKVS